MRFLLHIALVKASFYDALYDMDAIRRLKTTTSSTSAPRSTSVGSTPPRTTSVKPTPVQIAQPAILPTAEEPSFGAHLLDRLFAFVEDSSAMWIFGVTLTSSVLCTWTAGLFITAVLIILSRVRRK